MTPRRFRDPVGCDWTVWCVQPDGEGGLEHLPAGMRGGWLVFARGMEWRRLAPIPDGWRRLREAQLWALCEQAERLRAYAGIPFPG